MIAKTDHKNIKIILFTGLFLVSLVSGLWFELYYLIIIPFAVLFFYAGWLHVKAVFFLLLFTLPFSTELMLTDTIGTDFPDELLMIFTAGLFLCYWLYSPRTLSKKITSHPLIVLFWVATLWTIVTVLFSTHPVTSWKFLLAKCWYLGAFVLAPLIVFDNKESIKKAFITLAFATLLVVLIIMVKHYQYDFHFSGINPSLKPFFRNHVNYAAMLVCTIPVFFAIYKLNDSKKIKLLIAIASIILLTALFLSYSRGAWLALLTGSVSYWLIKRRLLLIAFIATIIIVLTSLFWIKTEDRYLEYAHDYRTTIFHEDFREHWRATYQLKDISTAERFYRWIAGVRMIKDNALTGYGPNTFYYNYKSYAVPAFKTWVSDNKEHSTVHNYFLLITIEQGIPGLIFFLLLVAAMLYYAERLYHRIQDRFYKTVSIITGVILMMILTVNFLSDLIETDKVGSLFFLCLSVIGHHRHQEQRTAKLCP